MAGHGSAERRVQRWGGSIISQRWVLTAAHVLQGADGDFYDRKTITVLAGVIKRPTEAQTVPPALEIENYIVHSDYKTEVGVPSFDIALLRMKEDIVFDHKRRPVCLPCTVGVSEVLPLPSQNWTSRCHHQDMVLTGLGGADYRAVSGFVSGWGLTEKSPWASEDLVHGAISVQPRELCGAALVNEGVFCANSVGVDACKGDSGGPFVIKRNGRWIQIGIVSYGSSYWCMNGTMGFYTSLPKFMPWIREQVGTDLVYT
ncbi:hypothetical protein AGOR_G00046740 [Albula goreensis]|uniref:Peptidase S1 domain-containing protein n=1 Tax=Albula goreensis TaxID=1534307 RepID=A0A8T3DRQ1_9TELE|nr:hypothetical protein AGOR_G00046740 [Albula goreensis]